VPGIFPHATSVRTAPAHNETKTTKTVNQKPQTTTTKMKTISTANHANRRKLKEGKCAELITPHVPARRAVVPRPRDEGGSRDGGFLNLHRFLVRPPARQEFRSSLGEGGFLNLRVLFSLFVMLAGVLLALLSFGPATTGFAQGTTREQMTLTLAQALAINPPACVPGQEMFNDVPASSPFCAYIEELARRGITGGCGSGNYCPGDPVSRQQMAVFLTKALGSEDVHLVSTAGEPSFQNDWHNVDPSTTAEAGFFKDALGIVHLQGAILTPMANNGSTAFTLPQGYRPAKLLFLPIAGSGVPAHLILQPDGQLKPGCGSSGGLPPPIALLAWTVRLSEFLESVHEKPTTKILNHEKEIHYLETPLTTDD
jgi:S-layer homology domain